MKGISDSNHSAFDLLAEPIQRVLHELGFASPTEPQSMAIRPILGGENVLLIAPTGSGKTEAALLPVFHNLLRDRPERGISVLYITPLRALNRDMLRRLMLWAARLGITVEVRHGDTPQRERRRQAVKPPDLLITTPETLQAILPGKRMRNHLRAVRWVVVDEIHELAQDKRGAQLTIALERLGEITDAEFQRIGVSATVGTPERVAGFLGGAGRDVRVVQVPVPKDYRYHVERPSPTEEDYEVAQTLYTSPEAAARIMRMKELMNHHTSTLLFVNSRQNAEMLGLRFTMLDPRVGVHHGSLSREERHRVEDEFKEGKLSGIICTSTLELGIDVGSVDLVVQYLSPRQVTPLIQRVGRSGHRVGRTSEGIIITAFPTDSLESIAAIERAGSGRLEPVRVHENALDVLAHQVSGLVMDHARIKDDAAYEIVRRAYPYRDLPRDAFQDVVEYLERLGEVGVEGGYLTRRRR
ncbi:MAG: DEAD/DEAH box helicase, partial [Candidatus Bathyarchaeia archaeon]